MNPSNKQMEIWDNYYLSARCYFETTGNLLVPISYVDENGLKLGQWIAKQRQYYLGTSVRGGINQERIKKLELIGMVWEPLAAQWEKSFSLAERFFKDNGHLHVPKNYITESGFKLNTWIANQRRKYHHQVEGELTEEQIEKLEKIGMMWNPYEDEWMQKYSLAKEYYKTTGNLLVPLRYVTESGVNLGGWISKQRLRKKGKSGRLLSQKQEDLLNSIGMVWEPREVGFEEFFVEAEHYYLTVGDLEVANKYITPSGMKLGIWIANQRAAYKKNNLSTDKIKRLEDIGMLWEVSNSTKQTSYPEQIVFYYLKREFSDAINRYSQLGFEIDIYIPSIRVGVEYDGVAWHKDKQSSDNKKNDLCRKEHIELFRLREKNCPKLNGNSIDISVGNYTIQNVVDACNTLFSLFRQKEYIKTTPYIDYNNDVKRIREYYVNAKNKSWDLMYKEAELYYLENGNLKVPFNYITEKGYQLGTWITNQRSNYAGYSGSAIDKNRVKKLEDIGMIWNIPDSQWQRGYEEAKKYFDNHGNIRVRVDYVTDTEYRLGVWISSQRKKKTLLSKDQINALNNIGMVWDVFDEMWDKGLDEAKRYYNTYGDLRVPAGFVSDSGFALGNWIAVQRSRYSAKKGTKALSKEQVIRLEKIGMIWDRVHDIWQQGYIHAKAYYNKHGNLLVPQRYVCDDGYALGAWIQNRRGGYNGTGSWAKPSAEQIKLLEQIGMVWDVEDYRWKKNYSLAKEYFNTHGHLDIPKRYLTKNKEHLGLWIQRQRRMYAGKTSKKLSDDRIRLLNEIGMIWDKNA